MYEGTERNFSKRKRVSDFGSNTGTGFDHLTDLNAVGSYDITLLTIFVADERDACAAVGVVLDGLDSSLAIVLVAKEVNHAVHLLVTATDVTHRHLTLVVASARALEGLEQGLLRGGAGDLFESADHLISGTGSHRFEFTYCHSP